jgi:hypothetical protein
VIAIVLGCVVASPLDKLHNAKDQISSLEQFLMIYNSLLPKMGLKDISVTCGLCGIVVNEVAGFIIENRSISEIETLIKNDICSHLGVVAEVCDLLVDSLPLILDGLENQWSVSVVCVDLKLCDAPFPEHADPYPMPKYVINLDLPPSERWNEICSVPVFIQNGLFLYNTINTLLPTGSAALEELGMEINDNYFPTEYGQEIKGCAAQMGIPYGWVALFNLGYEVSDACTSIVAQTNDGIIYHARSLDFWDGMGFTSTLKDMALEVDYQKGGKSLFKASTFAGMVGVLSGFKSGAFSATIDTRFYPGGLGQLFYEIIAAIQERNASLVSFLLRNVLENENDFNSALDNLSKDELIADVYYILAGVSAGQGAVISRNRTGSDDVWLLDAPTRWYEVETNYDHWEPAPWFDDRIDPANEAMDTMGRDNLSLPNMMKVLSVKPVLNLQTTYTILSCPATGEYESYTRYCEYPCVE